jgi:hypothetical protein
MAMTPRYAGVAAAIVGAMLSITACGGTASTLTPTATSSALLSASVAASEAATSPLVGHWVLEKSCEATVAGLRESGLEEFAPVVLEMEETIGGARDFDPDDPCANAVPPFEHSHTFWPDGQFNSYDQDDNEVDSGTYTLVGDESFTMGEPPITFLFNVEGDSLQLDVEPPEDCSSDQCQGTLAWAISVADPGQTWTRITSGPHAP